MFVICTLRSGSTLLRVLLDSHSQIRSPHELHLRYVSVHFDERWSERSMAELGLDTKGAEHLLWDRLLHRELAASGKRIIADKTPNNVFIVDRLREAWPDARFIYLLRHPAAIARSRQSVRGEHADDDKKNVASIRRYCEALEDARQTYDGHTVRYEDLTADPERETRAICAFLGLEWEPGMLEYGKLRPRPLQGRPRRLGRQDQDRPDPAARAAARRRGHPARPARDDREVGLPPRRSPARSQRVAAWPAASRSSSGGACAWATGRSTSPRSCPRAVGRPPGRSRRRVARRSTRASCSARPPASTAST